jgi:hypothetical protein
VFNIMNSYSVPPGLDYLELLDLLGSRPQLRRVCLARIDLPGRVLGYAAIATGAGVEVEVADGIDPLVLLALEELVPRLRICAGCSARRAEATIAS